MFNRNLQFSVSFSIIFIIQLITDFDQHASKLVLGEFYYLIKPSITISLMIFMAYSSGLRGRFAKFIFLGLLFSLFGDCFLMFVKVYPNLFIFGLISFLIAHLFYISAFYLDYKWKPTIHRKDTWLALIFFSIFYLGFYFFLRPFLGEMKIPVIIYAFVIAFMAFMSVNRKGRVSNSSYQLIFIGAMLFLISDSVLAYNKFVSPFKYSSVLIMTTYMIAQYLIVMGAILRKKKKHSVIELNS